MNARATEINSGTADAAMGAIVAGLNGDLSRVNRIDYLGKNRTPHDLLHAASCIVGLVQRLLQDRDLVLEGVTLQVAEEMITTAMDEMEDQSSQAHNRGAAA